LSTAFVPVLAGVSDTNTDNVSRGFKQLSR
jgi:hypothetical protein